MKKTIWIINQYASTLETGIGGRHYYFARELAKKGYDVYLFSAGYHHLLKKAPQIESNFKIEKVDGFNYVWIKMPVYKDAHSKMRIINEFIFSHKIRSLYKYFLSDLPEVILYSSPALVPYLGAYALAKKMRVRLVLDIRDLWPLTLIEMGGYSPKHPFLRYLQYVENKAYKTADYIVSNWPYSNDYMKDHYADPGRFSWIPNGFSIEEFEDSNALDEGFIQKLPKNKFIVGYTGTLGVANALNALLNTADKLREYDDIAFVIVGKGREKDEILQEIQDRGLQNIYLVGSVEKKQIPSILAEFDVCYVGFLNIPLYRFGSSLTKLPEYLFSGKPIVYASSSPFQPVQDANAGISVKAEDSKEIANAILRLYNMPKEERDQMGRNGRKAALEHYEYGMLAEKLAKLLFV